MKNIVHIGCSHSAGAYGPDGVKVPELLAMKSEGAYNVYNFAEYCNSVHNQLFQISELVHQSPDLVIVQWTSASRFTFVESKSRLENLYKFRNAKKLFEHYYTLDTKYNSPRYEKALSGNNAAFHVNASALDKMPKRHPKTNTYKMLLTETLSECGMAGSLFLTALKRHGKYLLEKNNIPYIMYEHTNVHSDDYEILDFAVERDAKNYKNYIVDHGSHFGLEGNNVVVNNFLFPLVKEKLNV